MLYGLYKRSNLKNTRKWKNRARLRLLKQLLDAIRFRINVQILIGQANIEDLELKFFLETINQLA